MNNTNYPDELYNKLLKFSSKEETDKLKLFDYQNHIYNYMTKTDARGILLYHSVGSGKCMAINTPILMFDGSIKKIQNIVVGDEIMGDDSTPRKVLSLARGVDDMYNVWYGSKKYTVNKEHILCLKTKVYPCIITSNDVKVIVAYLKGGSIFNYTFYKKDYGGNEDIMRNSIDQFMKNNKENTMHIAVKDLVKWPKDGQKMVKGYRERIYFSKNEIVKSPFLIGTLAGKGELNTIHIDYKINSIFVREYVVAGIIGSIGSISKYGKYNSYVVNINKSRKTFMNDFLFILDTLGIMYKSKLIEGKSYKITLYGKYLENIHKKTIFSDQHFNAGNECIEDGYSINIKYAGTDNYFGFCLDGNHRYALADCTITHNTMTSISVAEHFKKMGKKILILSSKSLQINYKKEIENFRKINEVDQNDIDDYKFITSNSRTMVDKITNSRENENGLDNVLNHINKESLDNKLIIVDEAHNLFNSIANGSLIANEFYDMVMKAKNLKIIFLTGTPIINDPFELAICYNMIIGNINRRGANGKVEKLTILPEYYTDFHSFFISNNGIKNEGKFKNRIFGLTSYYGDFYSSPSSSITLELKETIKKENYPDRLPIKFEIVKMSDLQNSFYLKARDVEKLENSRMGGGINAMDRGKSSTSYRIKSRQISNIYINEETWPYLESNKNISKFSSKIQKIYDNIKQNIEDIGNVMVYSTFLEYGVSAVSKLLDVNGWKVFKEDDDNVEGVPTYAVFSGKQSIEEKEIILKTYNSEENKTGSIIKLLFITKSGTEGLDLKNVRFIHIMEPYWNYSLIQQIIARGVRYKSHIMLEEKYRNVQTYIYLSDYNDESLKELKEKAVEMKNKGAGARKIDDLLEKTTDIHMFKNAVRNQELIYKFLKTIASTSIECKFFNTKELNYKCFSCKKTNERLFLENIYVDMKTKNNCIPNDKIKVEAKEIIVEGIKYYYSKSDGKITIYEESKNKEGSFIISKDKELESIVLNHLNNLELKDKL